MLQPTRKYLLALDAVLYIAYNAGAEPVSSRDIAAAIGFPQRYLEQVMQKLVRYGVLKGLRGPRGGYVLAKDRRKLTIGEVCSVLDASEPRDEDVGSRLGKEVLEPVWSDIENEAFSRLYTTTFEELCRTAEEKNIPFQRDVDNDFVI